MMILAHHTPFASAESLARKGFVVSCQWVHTGADANRQLGLSAWSNQVSRIHCPIHERLNAGLSDESSDEWARVLSTVQGDQPFRPKGLAKSTRTHRFGQSEAGFGHEQDCGQETTRQMSSRAHSPISKETALSWDTLFKDVYGEPMWVPEQLNAKHDVAKYARNAGRAGDDLCFEFGVSTWVPVTADKIDTDLGFDLSSSTVKQGFDSVEPCRLNVGYTVQKVSWAQGRLRSIPVSWSRTDLTESQGKPIQRSVKLSDDGTFHKFGIGPSKCLMNKTCLTYMYSLETCTNTPHSGWSADRSLFCKTRSVDAEPKWAKMSNGIAEYSRTGTHIVGPSNLQKILEPTIHTIDGTDIKTWTIGDLTKTSAGLAGYGCQATGAGRMCRVDQWSSGECD